ncbi:WhiB family transcriptional regulator [Rhodococcus jostii]|uniref:WhiB family transcriptional regulator n=1 Tax=Rhodococcus jostii TaxID=132919 RepID=UPI00363A6BC8
MNAADDLAAVVPDVACRYVDPELFAPVEHGKESAQTRAAKQICTDCGMTQVCARTALRDTTALFGVFAGVFVPVGRGRRRAIEKLGVIAWLPTGSGGAS